MIKLGQSELRLDVAIIFFFFRLPVNKQPLTKGRIDIQVLLQTQTRSLFRRQ